MLLQLALERSLVLWHPTAPPMVLASVLAGRHVKHSLSPSAACAAILLGKQFSQGGLWNSSLRLAVCTCHPICATSTHVENGYE